MNFRTLLAILGCAVLPWALECAAQPAGKVYRIGFILTGAPSEVVHLTKAFDDALRGLGWIEGRNIVIERRFADGRQERLPALAKEVVALKVDLIVTGSNQVIDAVKASSSTIPVVMAVSRDPVTSGFVASLARPGGHITGLTNDVGPDVQGKNLEILRQVLPRATRVAYLWNPVPTGAERYRSTADAAAQKLGITLKVAPVRTRDELDAVFSDFARERVDAVLVQQDPIFYTARERITQLAARHRLPAMYATSEFVEIGGLMSFGPHLVDQFRRAAFYVDKVLKGAKPADLAIEQPASFELVINRATAATLGLSIPPSVLVRADRLID